MIKKLIDKDTEKDDIFRFSSSSNTESEKMFYETENRLVDNMYEIRAFGGKPIGLVNRIAENLHISNYADNPGKYLIVEYTMKAAIEISGYATNHTLRTI